MSQVQEQHEPREKQLLQLTVYYNGDPKPFQCRPHERVEHLLVQARREFHVTVNPHLMGLFNEAGEELVDAQTLSEAKVQSGQELILRQSRVRGG
ncbi:MAG TPA: hypothetical protein VHT25_07165 [Solirubrobacteraceae bacterium]|jgi:hypothetical protein|nr:hypothetical protein [Solirubrobacteraceae bacterium]